MINDYFALAFKNLSHRRTRTWLTALGIFIGIAAVVALISIGQGLQDAVTKSFETAGSDRVTITAGGRSLGPLGGSFQTATLTEDDVKVVQKSKGVSFATGIIMNTMRVDYKDHTKYATLIAFDTNMETLKFIKTISAYQVEVGRELQSTDRYSVVIGWGVANELFDHPVEVGNHLILGGNDFTVVGIQAKAGAHIQDMVVRIPKDVERDLWPDSNTVSIIYAKTSQGLDPAVVAESIKKDLRRSRGVAKNEEDFTVTTSKQLLDAFGTVFTAVQAVLIGIAAISLIVGGIGIMNTMYTAVLERTKEIGIMKSVGATNRMVMLIFLFESGLLGIAGGVIGVLLGIGISKLVELIAGQLGGVTLTASMNPLIFIGALLFSFLVGAGSGVFPAMEAAHLHPVDALRRK